MWKRVRTLYKQQHKKNKHDNDKTNNNAIDNNNNNDDNDNHKSFQVNDNHRFDNNSHIINVNDEDWTNESSIINDNDTPSTARTLQVPTPARRTSITTVPQLEQTEASRLTIIDNEATNNINPNEKRYSTNSQTQKAHKHKFNFRKHLFKKHKGDSQDDLSNSIHKKYHRKASSPDMKKIKSLSQSTPDLSARRHSAPNPMRRDSMDKRLEKDNTKTSSRTSVTSVETLRENRRSDISKLDEYIKHIRKSIDEGNIASAPNRLCCAQILRMVYLRREQQFHYESLQNSRRQHKQRTALHSSTPNVQRQSAATCSNSSGSLQNVNDVAYDSSSLESPSTKVRWLHGSSTEDSDCSSVCSSEYNIHHRKEYERSSAGLIYRRNNFVNNARTCDSCCTTEDEGDSVDSDAVENDDECFRNNNSQNSNLNSHRRFKKNSRRKSMPIFPHALDIDIY